MNKDAGLFRQQLLIEPAVQGSLLCRAAFYSIACGLYFVIILIFTESMSNPGEPFTAALRRCLDETIYWAPGLVLLVPVVAYDLLQFTNRFAGPVYRLRREMQLLADGQSEYPLSFRDDDYWVDIADTFNQIRSELIERRARDRAVSEQTQAMPELTKPPVDEIGRYETDQRRRILEGGSESRPGEESLATAQR